MIYVPEEEANVYPNSAWLSCCHLEAVVVGLYAHPSPEQGHNVPIVMELKFYLGSSEPVRVHRFPRA